MRKIGSVLLLLVALVGCNTKSAYTEIVHEGVFSVEVPNTMKKTTKLNGEATLQLQNVKEELYLIVIKENKEEIDALFRSQGEGEEVFKKFSEATLLYLTATLDQLEPSELKLTEKTIHNLPVQTVDFTARIGGLDIYYKFSAFQGKDNYYQVLTWTLKEYKEKNQADMDKMSTSFKEV